MYIFNIELVSPAVSFDITRVAKTKKVEKHVVVHYRLMLCVIIIMDTSYRPKPIGNSSELFDLGSLAEKLTFAKWELESIENKAKHN